MDKLDPVIIQKDIDFYEYLGISPLASESEIRKAYRSKALKVHPDKTENTNSAEEFWLLSSIYSILTDSILRKSYDSVRTIKLYKASQKDDLEERTKQFIYELKLAEEEHRLSRESFLKTSDKYGTRVEAKLELLKESGIKKIREYEARMNSGSAPTKPSVYISYKDIISLGPKIDIFEKKQIVQNTMVSVKWKYIPDVGSSFDEHVLHEIMKVFGHIELVEVDPHEPGSPYDFGTVKFEQEYAAQKAVNRNYGESSDLWHGKKVEKLASLLEDCKCKTENDVAFHEKSNRIEDYEATSCCNSILKSTSTEKSCGNSDLDRILNEFMEK